MINILNKKNIYYISVVLILFITFLIFSGFSVPAFIIAFSGAMGLYLVLCKKQNTLFVCTLSIAVFFLFFYLFQIYNLSLWLTLIFASIIVYLLFCIFIVKEFEKKYQTFYAFTAILVLGEILVSINFLSTAILIKSLIITACFYFVAEVIKSNSNNKLKI